MATTGASLSCMDEARSIMHASRSDAIPRAFQVIVCAPAPNGYDGARGEVDQPVRGSSSGGRLPIHPKPAGMYLPKAMS